MPAPAQVGPRERIAALAAVAVIQALLALVLISGLRVSLTRAPDVIQRLVNVTLMPPPPPPRVEPVQPKHAAAHAKPAAAATAERQKTGGSPAAVIAPAPPSIKAVIAIRPSAAPGGGIGGRGNGPALGTGAGGGTGGSGAGEGDDGGTGLEKIGGEILPSDYPKSLGNAGIGGRVSVTFTVEVSGRVTGCRVTRSSGIAQLDALTCRLMEERFRFRPSTDRYGRPVRDEVDWDHDWVAPRS